MSTPEQTRFDELVSRYLDATLGDADEHELVQYLADEALVARFHEATQLDTEIAGILAGSVPDEVMVRLVVGALVGGRESLQNQQTLIREMGIPVPVPARRPRSWVTVGLAVATVAILLLAAFVYFVPHPPAPRVAEVPAKPAGAAISSVQGEVYLIGPNGRVSLSRNLPLTDGGTIQTVGRNSRVTVALRDGSEIELKGDTTFTAELGAEKRRLLLQQGMLVANVTKQPEDAPMVINSNQATATVRGTQLAMVEEKSGTYLIVTEGAVTLQRASGGPEVLIEAGFYGHVEKEGQFHPFPIFRLPRALREQLPER
jgi:hypothetical protein